MNFFDCLCPGEFSTILEICWPSNFLVVILLTGFATAVKNESILHIILTRVPLFITHRRNVSGYANLFTSKKVGFHLD